MNWSRPSQILWFIVQSIFRLMPWISCELPNEIDRFQIYTSLNVILSPISYIVLISNIGRINVEVEVG